MQGPGAHRRESERGQASVELLGTLPVALLVALVSWQLVLAGQATWLAGNAARVAARAKGGGGGAGSRFDRLPAPGRRLRSGHVRSRCGGRRPRDRERKGSERGGARRGSRMAGEEARGRAPRGRGASKALHAVALRLPAPA